VAECAAPSADPFQHPRLAGRPAGSAFDRERVPQSERRALHGVDARYEGQNFEVYVALDGLALDRDVEALDAEFVGRFRAAHASLYGYDIRGRAIEIVTLRLKTIGAVAKPNLAAAAADGFGRREIGRRPVYFDGASGWVETPIYDRLRFAIGAVVAGPAVIEEMSATTLLHPGRHAVVDAAGNLIVTVSAE
jgi:N-methylhydantoinase A